MSLLRQIQDDAVDSSKPLGDLLRKCRVLAYRLGHEEFKEWVEFELNGYPDEKDTPPYRVAHAESYGDFSGPFQSGLRNAPIPPSNVPEKFREIATTVYFRESISALEDLVKDKKGGTLRSAFPGDLVPLLKVYEHMNCLSAWRQIAPGSVISILDNVRNRVLNFSLEIEAKAPAAGEAKPGEHPVPKDSINQIFNMVVYGGTVAAGSHHFTQSSITEIKQGDIDSLVKFLESQGISKEDSKQLVEAVKEDPPPKDASHLGSRVSSWMGRMIAKTASGAWKIATEEGAKILMEAVKRHYGL